MNVIKIFSITNYKKIQLQFPTTLVKSNIIENTWVGGEKENVDCLFHAAFALLLLLFFVFRPQNKMRKVGPCEWVGGMRKKSNAWNYTFLLLYLNG